MNIHMLLLLSVLKLASSYPPFYGHHYGGYGYIPHHFHGHFGGYGMNGVGHHLFHDHSMGHFLRSAEPRQYDMSPVPNYGPDMDGYHPQNGCAQGSNGYIPGNAHGNYHYPYLGKSDAHMVMKDVKKDLQNNQNSNASQLKYATSATDKSQLAKTDHLQPITYIQPDSLRQGSPHIPTIYPNSHILGYYPSPASPVHPYSQSMTNGYTNYNNMPYPNPYGYASKTNPYSYINTDVQAANLPYQNNFNIQPENAYLSRSTSNNPYFYFTENADTQLTSIPQSYVVLNPQFMG